MATKVGLLSPPTNLPHLDCSGFKTNYLTLLPQKVESNFPPLSRAGFSDWLRITWMQQKILAVFQGRLEKLPPGSLSHSHSLSLSLSPSPCLGSPPPTYEQSLAALKPPSWRDHAGIVRDAVECQSFQTPSAWVSPAPATRRVGAVR